MSQESPGCPAYRESPFPISIGNLLFLVALLIFPLRAFIALTGDMEWRLPIGYLVTISVVTYYLYWKDKRRAIAGEWRVPEATLHLAEITGGWPAAFIAQKHLRHKTRKVSYQFVFWMIVLIHQWLSMDYLAGWSNTRILLIGLADWLSS